MGIRTKSVFVGFICILFPLNAYSQEFDPYNQDPFEQGLDTVDHSLLSYNFFFTFDKNVDSASNLISEQNIGCPDNILLGSPVIESGSVVNDITINLIIEGPFVVDC